MPTEPAQLTLVILEIVLMLSGIGLVVWLLGHPGARSRWLNTNALPATQMATPDFVLCAILVFPIGFAFQAAAQLGLGPLIAPNPDRPGLAMVAYSVANFSGALIAWRLLLPSLRRSWLGTDSPPTPPPVPLPWARALRYAAGTLLVALPVLTLVSLAWTQLAKQLGLPVAPQDVIAIFTNTRSPLVIAGMLLVACVFAPIYEELLFRAGLYRFCRQRIGRGGALIISGVCFGALHGNWAGFAPLALLGMGLAIAYEATGSIRVPIIAHGLFNLNTILLLLAGLQDVAP